MKNITMVLDGAADRPNEKLGGKTPLEYAKTPNLDALYGKSTAGVVSTIPSGMEIGSAVANLSLLGFDPSGYRGRAVIEAAGLGMPINKDDLYIRCNMVTFEGEPFEASRMKSYSAFDIPTQDAQPVAQAVSEKLFCGRFALHYCGSFRNILIVQDGASLYPLDFEPAHDIIGQPVAPYIRHDGKQAEFFTLMQQAFDYMHTLGSIANGMWFWGASVVPEIHSSGSGRIALSETLLMNGITKIGGVKNIETEREGVSYEKFLQNKLENALSVVNEYDDIYVHFQETDDLSHELMPLEKAQAIEAFDSLFLRPFIEAINGSYSLKIASDHYTFSDTGAHGGEPVPFLCYHSDSQLSHDGRFTEAYCRKAGNSVTAAQLKEM